MNYEDSVSSLLALGRELAAPQQARVQKFGLENISALAADLGNPHRAIPCAHIAGTMAKARRLPFSKLSSATPASAPASTPRLISRASTNAFA